MILLFLEKIINRMLTLDAHAKARLTILEGKWLEVHIEDGPFLKKIFCLFHNAGIQLRLIINQPVNMVIKGKTSAFLKLAISQDLHLAARLGLAFEGDPLFLDTVQQLFFSLNIDWEEALSQWTGDIVAHQAGRLIRYTQKQQKEVLTSITQNFSEYLKEESKLSLSQTEVDHFSNAVDNLRAKIDRLEARVKYLVISQGIAS